MMRHIIKPTFGFLMLCLLGFSSNSFAGDIYGKVGYGHYPFKIVVGYNDYGKRHHYKHYKKHKRYYYVPQHYRHHHYKHHYGYKSHYYKPRRYCRSRY